MKLMSMKQYSKMTKAGLVRKIMKALKKLPKTKLIKLCYELEKRRLPTISTMKKLEKKGYLRDYTDISPRLTARRAFPKPFPKSPKILKHRYARIEAFRQKPRSAKQLANDKRLGLMAKKRAKAKRSLLKSINRSQKRKLF